MFVSVGSASNIDDPVYDTSRRRIALMCWNLIRMVRACAFYAYGIRNCVGLAIQPETHRVVVFGQRT